jgi:thiamine transporter ThiT
LSVIGSLSSLDKFNNDNFCLTCFTSTFMVITSIFQLIWNVIGSIVFWGYIYTDGNCNTQFSTYVCVSLIIKLIGNLLSVLNYKKDKN